MTIQCILFDLDGTVVDTAPDLGAALNRLLAEHGREPLSADIMRPYSSKGARGLLKIGFDVEQEDEAYNALRTRYLELYAENICDNSQVFDGINACIEKLAARGISWGVVTNKPIGLTTPLMNSLEFTVAPACIVGADQVPRPKPDPASLELACAITGFSPDQCLYVGDAKRDIVAGCRAGMRTIAVRYGYILPGDSADSWGADWVIDQPAEILDCLVAEAA